MTTPIQYSGPAISSDVPWEIRVHLQAFYQKLANHTQAFSILAAKATSSTTTNTTVTENITTGGVGSPGGVAGIPVNNQSGVTSYSTTVFDNGGLLVLSDASPVSVTLVPSVAAYGFFVANQGAGTVTLTPSSGTISYAGSPGAVSMPLLGGYCAMVAYDGANWWAWTEPIVPVTFGAVAHEFLTAYNAATGAWSAAQPAFTDISGQISTSQLPSAGLSVTITTAKLTTLGTNGSQTFTNGQLTAQVPAT
jgi:hypothetical protein